MNAWSALRQHWAEAAKSDPDFRTPEEIPQLQAMHQAYLALMKLGWQDAIYCPKDGTVFLAITAGSTGVHPCHYQGSWPDGRWWILEAGDAWPARPILWKPLPQPMKTEYDEAERVAIHAAASKWTFFVPGESSKESAT